MKLKNEKLDTLTFKDIIDQIAEGKTYQDILEISDEDMQTFYQIALDYLNHQQFEEASDCFLFLTALNPFESNLWIKTGNIEFALGHYHEALSTYSMAMLWDADDPFPHYYSSEAYQMLGDSHHAKECINICLRLINEHVEYRPLQEQAHQLLELITKV